MLKVTSEKNITILNSLVHTFETIIRQSSINFRQTVSVGSVVVKGERKACGYACWIQ